MRHYQFIAIIILILGKMLAGCAAAEAQPPAAIPAVPLKQWTIKDVTSAGGEILGMDIEDNLVLLLRSRALELVDFSTPARPVLLSRMDMPGRATDMAVRGHAAYVGVRYNGIHMIDFTNPRAPRERGLITTDTLQIHLGVEGPYLRVWAHYKGDGVVDILRVDKNPWQPEEAWDEDRRHTDRYAVIGATALQIHSYYDSKETLLTVKAPDDEDWRTILRFPYRPESGEGKLITSGKQGAVLADGRLYLLDLKNSLKPTVMGEVVSSQFESTDNVSGGHFSERLLLIDGYQPIPIDISAPRHPRVINWKCPESFEQAWLVGSVMLVRCKGNINPPGVQNERYWLTAYDFSNPTAPEERTIPIGEMSNRIHVLVRGRMAYAMLPDGKLKVIDCSNPKAIRMRGTMSGMMSPNGAWEERVWEIRGSQLFIADHEGVKVVDLTDPDHPAILGTYRTVAQDTLCIALGRTPQGKPLAWVADRSGRLEALDLAQPAGAVLQGWIDLQGEPQVLKIGGQHAYIGSDGRISIIDIHQPEAPSLIKTLAIQGEIEGLALTGNLLLVATGKGGLVIFDVKNPRASRLLGTYSPKSGCWGLAARGELVFLAGPALEVISVADPAHPRRVGWLPAGADDEGFEAQHVVLYGRTAFTPQLVDLANPAAPRWVESFKIEIFANHCLASAGRFAYFLNTLSWSGGSKYTLSAYDATNPLQPVKQDEYDTLINTYAMTADEAGNLFIADGIGGVVQLQMAEETRKKH